MEYSVESLHFLHVAYVLMALGQIAYVVFLAKRWSDTSRKIDGLAAHAPAERADV